MTTPESLTEREQQALEHMRKAQELGMTLKIARLGGYLARAHDSPPGNTVMWRGLARLTDIQIGFALASE